MKNQGLKLAIDNLIMVCHKPTIKETISFINSLCYLDREMLKNEYEKNPDSRFSDNLLVAISHTFYPYKEH